MPGVTFLGVGGAMAAQPADNHTALLVEADEVTLLLDCGPTIMRQLERVGVDAGLPSHVYLSHQHGDHLLGLPMLLLNRVLFFPDQPLAVLAMPGVKALALVHRMRTERPLAKQYRAEAARYLRGEILTPHAGDQFVF